MSIPPKWMIDPIPEFEGEFEGRVLHGRDVLENSSVAVVGLARNCGPHLQRSLDRFMETIARTAKSWRLLICENDSEDNTKDIATRFASLSNGKADAIVRDLHRKHRPNEFAGPRTEELAEYREECQNWIRHRCDYCEYVAVIDWDAWGGWTGEETAFSYLSEDVEAYGMASVSLLEHPVPRLENDGRVVIGTQWMHYDCWALRLNSFWDDYSVGAGGWKHQWLPPVGSPTVRVCSAFGGLCVYKTGDYLRGTYSGQDCEHVTFHRSIHKETGKSLYLNPSQRTIMKWVEQNNESHGDSTDQPVQG